MTELSANDKEKITGILAGVLPEKFDADSIKLDGDKLRFVTLAGYHGARVAMDELRASGLNMVEDFDFETDENGIVGPDDAVKQSVWIKVNQPLFAADAEDE